MMKLKAGGQKNKKQVCFLSFSHFFGVSHDALLHTHCWHATN